MSRRKSYLLTLLLLAAVLAFSAQLIDARHAAYHLRQDIDKSMKRIAVLKDEQRSLNLEMATRGEFAKVYRAAAELGMVEPALEAGTLFYLRERD